MRTLAAIWNTLLPVWGLIATPNQPNAVDIPSVLSCSHQSRASAPNDCVDTSASCVEIHRLFIPVSFSEGTEPARTTASERPTNACISCTFVPTATPVIRDALEISGGAYAACSGTLMVDKESDMVIDTIRRLRFDRLGRLVDESADLHNDGTTDFEINYIYDASNRLAVVMTTQAVDTITITSTKRYHYLQGGSIDSIDLESVTPEGKSAGYEYFWYLLSGDMAGRGSDANGNGALEARERYQYDEHHNRTVIERVADSEEAVTGRSVYLYDTHQKLKAVWNRPVQFGRPYLDEIECYDFVSDDRLVMSIWDSHGRGLQFIITIERLNGLLKSQEYQYPGSEAPESRVEYGYDDQNRIRTMTTYEHDVLVDTAQYIWMCEPGFP